MASADSKDPEDDSSDQELWDLVAQYKALTDHKRQLLGDTGEDDKGSDLSDISQMSLITEQLEALAQIGSMGDNASDMCYIADDNSTDMDGTVPYNFDDVQVPEIKEGCTIPTLISDVMELTKSLELCMRPNETSMKADDQLDSPFTPPVAAEREEFVQSSLESRRSEEQDNMNPSLQYERDTFRSKVSKTFLKRTAQLKLNQKSLTIEKVDPPHLSHLRQVCVSGITSSISADVLELYLESSRRSGGGEVIDIALDVEQGKAIVTFRDTEVAQRLLQSDKQHIISDAILSITPVSSQPLVRETLDPRVVMVTGITGMSSDLLQLYMESERRSGGGDIESLKVSDKGDHAIVTFEELRVARRVLKKRQATFDGKTLSFVVPRPKSRTAVSSQMFPNEPSEQPSERIQSSSHLKDANVARAIKTPDDIDESAIDQHVFDNPETQNSIANMTQKQLLEVWHLMDLYEVDIKIELRGKMNRIIVAGMTKAVQACVIIIKKILAKVQERIEEEEAALLYQQIRWQFETKKSVFKDYPPQLNYLIHKAHLAQCEDVTWEEDDGGRYLIIFSEGVERQVGKDNSGATVRYTLLEKGKGGNINENFPYTWTPMQPGENCQLVDVRNNSKEFAIVAGKFHAILIKKLQRVQNPELYKSFDLKKRQMYRVLQDSDNEMQLYYGTSEDAVKSIYTHGLNRSYSGKNANPYGDGVYLAVNSQNAASPQYARPNVNGQRFIFQCDVLVGEFTQGSQRMKEPPLKDQSAGLRYNSVVDDPESPSMFIIFNDAQVYPHYLITF